MPLSARTRRVLVRSLKSEDIGDEVADIIDAGSGTLSAYARAKIYRECGNAVAGDHIADKIDAGTALSDWGEHHLAHMLKNRPAAKEIITALAL